MTLVLKFEAGLRPVFKHGTHDQKTHGSWATGLSELSDDDYRDIIYSAKSVEEAYTTIAKRLGKSMKPQIAELSEDEINVYRGVQNVERDTKRLLDGKIKFTDFQTWGQGIYVDPTKERAADYGTVLGLRLDPSAKILRGEMEWDRGIDIRWQNENARVPGQWTSDFVDMSRIKMNPDDFGRPNYSVSDLKNLYWASKGFDGFSPHGGEMVLFNAEKLTLNQSTVQKHGTHDQKTHGNWATGVGYKESDKHPRYDFNSLDGVNVEHYTNEGYEEINKFLRTGKTDPMGEEPDDLRDYIRSMDKEIAKTSAPRDMVLFRGTSGVGKFENLKEGDVFTDKAFVSTTTDVETVWEFMSTATGGRFDSRPFEKGYVLEISVPKNSQVLSVNNYFKDVSSNYGPSADIRTENEHILPRGTKFRVDSIGSINVRMNGIQDKLLKVSVVK